MQKGLATLFAAKIEDTFCIVFTDNLCTPQPEKDVHVYSVHTLARFQFTYKPNSSLRN